MFLTNLKKTWLDKVISGFVIAFLFRSMHDLIEKLGLPFADFEMFLVVVLVLIVGGWIGEYFRRKKVVSFVDKDFAVNRKGVIFTLGIWSHTSASPQMKVLHTLKPELVGFLTTEEIESKRGVVDNIVCAERLKQDSYRRKPVDPTNMKDIKDNVSVLIEWMLKTLSRDEIVIDITGGTAVMSCGAYEAAAEYGVDVEYVYSDYDFDQNKWIPDTQKALIVGSRRKKGS